MTPNEVQRAAGLLQQADNLKAALDGLRYGDYRVLCENVRGSENTSFYITALSKSELIAAVQQALDDRKRQLEALGVK